MSDAGIDDNRICWPIPMEGEPIGNENLIWFRLLVAYDLIFTLLGMSLVEIVLVG